jgi:hypothetical protein
MGGTMGSRGTPGPTRRWLILGGLGGLVWRTTPPRTAAQPPSASLRLALVPEWVIRQHRVTGGLLGPALGQALEGGVVDRTVFAWQRGVIQREALVTKPVRLLPEAEAGPLGGQGRFELGAVRPPRARAAWTEVEIRRASAASGDVLLLEVGGELNTVAQVLETLVLVDAAGRLVELPLARSALFPGRGVPVVTAPFGRPLPAALAARFYEEGGVGLLVVRSQVRAVRDGGLAPGGFADTAPLGEGDWREGDRVLLRVPAAGLERAPRLVLAWKDRTLQPDPDGEVFPRRSSWLRPPAR